MKMKHLSLRIFFLILIAGLILSGCNKDTKDTPLDNIIGTWTAGTHTFTVMIGTKTLTQYFIEVAGMSESDAQLYTSYFNQAVQQSSTGTIQIKSEGTYTTNLGGETDTGTWSLSSDGKILTIDSSTDDPFTAEIVELTSSKLRFKMSESMSEDMNNDQIPETLTINFEMVFTR